MGRARIAPGFPSLPLLSALALPGCGGASFNTPFTVYTSIASADLNGDGNADIAVADSGALVYYQDPVRHGIFFSPVRVGT